VSFREEMAGRETLAAIAEARGEALQPVQHRAPSPTQFYGDRISNAPGAVSPKTARALDDAPEVTVTFLPAGRATRAAIDLELHGEGPQIEIHEEPLDEAEESLEMELADSVELTAIRRLSIEQQHTFIVRARSEELATLESRNLLLQERLLKTLADTQLADVTKVVVESHGEEASLVRFWTQVR